MVPAHTAWTLAAPAALRPTICSLLYRLLIICVHLQRHSAIGYLLPLADLMLSAPSACRHLLIGKARRASPFLPLPCSSKISHDPLLLLFFLFGIIRTRLYLSTATHYNYQDKSRRPLGILLTAKAHEFVLRPLNLSARTRERMFAIRKTVRKLSRASMYILFES